MLIKHSVIIPIKDEEQNIPILAAEVETVMEKLNAPWELIYIDDGSKDNSLNVLKKLKETMPQLRVLSFAQNYGQSSAFDAGFKLASGELIITLDGDLQNDPSDIPKLLEALNDHDMACGWRQSRKDTFFKRVISKPSNVVRSRLCKDQMHDTGCSLKVFRKSSLSKIKGFHGMHRFFPALFRVEGMTIVEVSLRLWRHPQAMS